MPTIYDPIDPTAQAGTPGSTPWVYRFDTPTTTNALLQMAPPTPSPQNQLAPPPVQPPATTNLSVADLIAQLKGPNPPSPISPGMTDTNLTNLIYSTPKLQSMLAPDAGGPQYAGAPLLGHMPPGWANGTDGG